jgi:glycine/D-amino acid oxidase-like deaminating enzyme
MTTHAPETDAAERRRGEWAKRLVLSLLTPSGDFVHPSYVVEAFADALRSAEKDAALAMRERAARAVEAVGQDLEGLTGNRFVRTDRAVKAVRSLEV